MTTPEGVELCRDTDAIARTAKSLAQGAVAAIKGLGGFHLVCMATGDAGQQAFFARQGFAEVDPAQIPASKWADYDADRRPLVHCLRRDLDPAG